MAVMLRSSERAAVSWLLFGGQFARATVSIGLFTDLGCAEARIRLCANPMARLARPLAKVQLFEPWPLALQTRVARAPAVTVRGHMRDTSSKQARFCASYRL